MRDLDGNWICFCEAERQALGRFSTGWPRPFTFRTTIMRSLKVHGSSSTPCAVMRDLNLSTRESRLRLWNAAALAFVRSWPACLPNSFHDSASNAGRLRFCDCRRDYVGVLAEDAQMVGARSCLQLISRCAAQFVECASTEQTLSCNQCADCY